MYGIFVNGFVAVSACHTRRPATPSVARPRLASNDITAPRVIVENTPGCHCDRSSDGALKRHWKRPCRGAIEYIGSGPNA